MANAHMIIDEKDWEGLPEKKRSWIMYNTMRSVEQRVSKLERRKWLDKGLTFAGGILGGFLAYIGII